MAESILLKYNEGLSEATCNTPPNGSRVCSKLIASQVNKKQKGSKRKADSCDRNSYGGGVSSSFRQLESENNFCEEVEQFSCSSRARAEKRRKKSTVTCSLDNKRSKEVSTSVSSALGNYVILRSIFKHLRLKDLKRCRLVSSTWKTYTTSFLQEKILPLMFADEDRAFCYSPKGTSSLLNYQKVRHLTSLVRSSMSLSSSCTFLLHTLTFHMEINDLHSPSLQNLFSTYGHFIKHLTIGVRCNNHDSSGLNEYKLQIFLYPLLCKQARHLKSFSMLYFCSMHPESESMSSQDFKLKSAHCSFPPINSDNHIELRLKNPKLHKQHKRNTNLLAVDLRGTFCTNLMQWILEMAPNLKRLVHNEEFFGNFLPLKFNCLNLLQDASLDLSSEEGRAAFLFLEAFVETESPTLYQMYVRIPNEEPALKTRAVKVLNKLLDSSKNSLKKIVWGSVSPLKGIRWPKEMPELAAFVLLEPFGLSGQELVLFPPNFNFAKVFPWLETIVLESPWRGEDFMDFLNVFRSPVPLTSVRRFQILKKSLKSNTLLQPLHLKRISALFPSAEISRIKENIDYQSMLDLTFL